MEAFGPEAQPANEVSSRSKWAPGNPGRIILGLPPTLISRLNYSRVIVRNFQIALSVAHLIDEQNPWGSLVELYPSHVWRA
jgi:hypothetical protein